MRLSDYSIYATADALPEEYRDCVHPVTNTGMMVFQHPASVQIMPLCLPLPIEEYIARWEERVADLLTQGDLARHMAAYERAFRMERLVELSREHYFDTVRDQVKFWSVARWVWTDSEMPEDDPLWGELLEADIPNRRAMMSHADRAALAAMPSTLTVYRGGPVRVGADGRDVLCNGFSWTLDRRIAEKFARRFRKRGQFACVLTLEIKKEDVLLYTNERGEQEILLDHRFVEWLDATEEAV